jgi:predicted adenylyl cyclase CyaB
MAIEIELKAWVDDPGVIREKLGGLALYNGEFLKEDSYWKQENPGTGSRLSLSGVRIRKESGRDAEGNARDAIIVTCKSKETREGLEVNHEREFSVSDVKAFGEFLEQLGFKPVISKRKSGFSWNYNGITAELTEVAGLGWFAELEILAGDSEPETVRTARRRLLELLAKLGIDEARIEPRYYTEMLRA